MNLRRLLIVMIAACAALVAGCGGGGGGDAPPGAAAPVTETPAGGGWSGTVEVVPSLPPAPAPVLTPTLTVRARGDLAGGVGPVMEVLVDGSSIATVEVRSTVMADYTFKAADLRAGAKVDLVFKNDGKVGTEDRNLYIAYVLGGTNTVLPNAPGVIYDRGAGVKAFDGVNTSAGSGSMFSDGALRFNWPSSVDDEITRARKYEASRFLQQATFGPTLAEIEHLENLSFSDWLNQQMAQPHVPDFVNYVQAKYNLGDGYRPKGGNYKPSGWVSDRFWATNASGSDQLRKRVAFALHQVFVVSQVDPSLYWHVRAYANYMDTLNKHAFGNFRSLLEDMALSPAMGIYLSHMRNRKEDAISGRQPDENFAREVMQLFTIGLNELNIDGSMKLDGNGRPIETYTNADVMALAKVFTGWSWGFPDNELTQSNFRWGDPDYKAANDRRIDLLNMKAYPGQHSTAEKPLFAGKPWARTIPADTAADESLRLALDVLFNHPNVGPFIGRQLIQRLVTSNPSPAYVARVAGVFNNNGQGVRGDLGAVVRAILLDSDARSVPAAGFGKLREPVLRVTQWMRAFSAVSVSGEYLMGNELTTLSQRPMYTPSVFGDFRPGYVPPNTAFADAGATAPEFQIVNESTTASWVNIAESMAGDGLGWNVSTRARDISTSLGTQVALSAGGDVDGLLENINLLLFAGQMSKELRLDMLDAVASVGGSTEASHLNRARVAVYLALSSPEYLVQH